MGMVEAMIESRNLMFVFSIVSFIVVVVFDNPPGVLMMGLLWILFASFITFHKNKLQIELSDSKESSERVEE